MPMVVEDEKKQAQQGMQGCPLNWSGSERWTFDRGSIPGEPFAFLDGDCDSAVAAMVELENPGKPTTFEVRKPDGVLVAQSEFATEAAEIAERLVAPATVVEYPKCPIAKEVLVPAQVWEAIAENYSGHRLAEASMSEKTPEAVTVPAHQYGGYLYAVFSNLYGGRSGIYRSEAWQLMPRRLYEGPTFTHDSMRDCDESIRARGDYTGFVVKVKGSEMVCAKPVHFIRSLPTVAPISMSEALRYDTSQRECGWRTLRCKSNTPTWAALEGHPVVLYEGEDAEHSYAVLLWKHEGAIHEYHLPEELAHTVQKCPEGVETESQEIGQQSGHEPVQAALF